jgi:hypothetical protein
VARFSLIFGGGELATLLLLKLNKSELSLKYVKRGKVYCTLVSRTRSACDKAASVGLVSTGAGLAGVGARAAEPGTKEGETVTAGDPTVIEGCPKLRAVKRAARIKTGKNDFITYVDLLRQGLMTLPT